MPASTHLPPRRRVPPALCAVLAGSLMTACAGGPEISMPDVRGKSCAYYAGQIATLSGVVTQKAAEAQAETAGFMAASIGMSLLIPFAGLALIPAENEAKKDNWQASSDLWTFRASYKAKDCLPLLPDEGESK